MAGASWVQTNILEAYPDADIDVTAVWFNMLFSDSRESWDPNLLTDPRVTHYWDPDQDIGRWFDQNEQVIGFEFNKGPVVWDSFLLFGPEATWSGFPAPLISFGNTVIADNDELHEATMTLLGPIP